MAVRTASTFGKDDQGHTGFDGLRGGRERAHGVAGVGAVDGDLAGALEMPADERQTEELDLGEDPELEGQADIKHWDVQGRGVIGGVDGGLGEVDAVESLDGEGRRGRCAG